ncbi:hypothetical protein KDAU_08520 [Dictyobacter aurantiacus]|uniref:Uncharacterized protein n=2 Tax=Dictyobacter aurantiacus TaxID=1936993 RepID=A0A401Z9N5_9CHLR|nr:hypothetical protein KDAU_08520 [Dictyobacter aurantiacus]
MTTFPLLTCCELLSIDPKTLRNWLRQANMSLQVHPTDRRAKCLSMEQVQHLAALHHRALPSNRTETSSVSEPIPLPDEATRLKQIAYLEAQMASFHQQLTQLYQPPPVMLPTPAQQKQIMLQEDVPTSAQEVSGDGAPDTGRQYSWIPLPAESRRRRVVPLIEYGAAGTYVIVCPQQGELLLAPDTPAWFAWLASISSFRFVGKAGRLGACRGYDQGPRRTWYAYRTIHQRDYKHYLGTTDHLTISCLEHMAATFQSYVE